MNITAENSPSPKAQTPKRSIWYHLHFWIGWISAIPIALVCLTGALLVFSTDITHWENKDLFQLEPTGPRPSIQQVLEVYNTAEPKYLVSHLGIPEDPHHVYKAYVTAILPEGNRGGQVFFNPYTGELIPLSNKFSLANTITEIHRHLIGNKAGQMIVAISSVLLALTCIFGLILWLPMKARTFVRTWKRGQALDWHNALGVVTLLPLIVMAITGVTFTWGKQMFPVLDKLQGAPSRQLAPVVSVPDGAVKLPFQVVVERVEASFPGVRITGVQPSNGKKSPHVFIMDGDGNNLKLFMDPYTGAELMRMDGTGTGPVGWYRERFGKLHTFNPYGMFWRIVWGLLSLGGTILVVTGMWVSVKRWRRPKRRAV